MPRIGASEDKKVDCPSFRSEQACIKPLDVNHQPHCIWKPSPKSSLTTAYRCFEHGGVMEYLPHGPLQWIVSAIGLLFFVVIGGTFCYIEYPTMC